MTHNNMVTDCRACVRRELAIITYVETIALLEAERDSLREDVAHCREVIAAAVAALHTSHVKARHRDELYARLLAEFRALRSQVGTSAHVTRAA
jgi:hypothetical protein